MHQRRSRCQFRYVAVRYSVPHSGCLRRLFVVIICIVITGIFFRLYMRHKIGEIRAKFVDTFPREHTESGALVDIEFLYNVMDISHFDSLGFYKT
jgi:hypothetical protein